MPTHLRMVRTWRGCVAWCRDAVDVIGIDAYYNVDGPDLGGKVHAWRSHLALGARLHQQYGKLVAFTEIGYCSGHCKRTHTPTPADYATHAEHYTAVFEALRNVTYSVSGGGGGGSSGWFLGSFWWNVRAQFSLCSISFAVDACRETVVHAHRPPPCASHLAWHDLLSV